ncbi:RHS repeat domain-containing protein [Brevibacillus sp. FIR094]|uniref:RHS repeat domain-containing protein n=1 Tax=Brevibacillus sp. FIR094 TaxID=3134809 RepID=UPI003D232028
MELEENGAAKAYYVYGLGLIGREDVQGDYLSYHVDTRGSTTLLTDEHGRVTDRYTYGLYGELEAHEGRTKQPFCYNGRDGVMTDPNGLYYMRARYYHPGLKRFLNRDVLQGDMTDGQTFNRFAYVNGDPIGFIDPLGLMKCKAWKDKIVLPSKPHTNKTPGHWFASMRKAVQEAKKDDTVKVYLNKGLQNEVASARPRRPDVMVVKSNGKINQYEVPSTTDDPAKLVERMIDNQKELGSRAGSIQLLPIKK